MQAPGLGPASERAIAMSLGWHVRAVMDRSWDIDCEYNRAGVAGSADVKRWSSPARDEVGNEPDQAPVTPDLIIHRRGLTGEANNLLVMELKTRQSTESTPSSGRSGGSLESILNIQKQHAYQHAVLLNLQLSPKGLAPQWVWAELAEDGKPDHVAQLVFDAAVLTAFQRQGSLEDKRRYVNR